MSRNRDGTGRVTVRKDRPWATTGDGQVTYRRAGTGPAVRIVGDQRWVTGNSSAALRARPDRGPQAGQDSPGRPEGIVALLLPQDQGLVQLTLLGAGELL